MTNTTRTLAFRSLAGATLLRVTTDVPKTPTPFAVGLTTQAGDDPTWSWLVGDQVEELHELTGLVLAGRKLEYGDDGVQDARIVCGYIVEGPGGQRVECCLDLGHVALNGDECTHITSSGDLFRGTPLPF